MDFFRGLAVNSAFVEAYSQSSQSCPKFAIPNVFQIRDDGVSSLFDSAVAIVCGRNRRDLVFG
jgi:hypothetical protein